MFANLISSSNPKFKKFETESYLEPKGFLSAKTGTSFIFTPYWVGGRPGRYSGMMSSVVDVISISGDICTVKTLNSVYVFKVKL